MQHKSIVGFRENSHSLQAQLLMFQFKAKFNPMDQGMLTIGVKLVNCKMNKIFRQKDMTKIEIIIFTDW
jgi:hypothetical protein